MSDATKTAISLVIFNARLVDSERDTQGALLISDGKIASVVEGNFANASDFADTNLFSGASEFFDAGGLTVMPSFIDMHAHFRYPGQSEKETLETGLKAACAGGYGTLVLMPNTNPPVSDLKTALAIQTEAQIFGLADIVQSLTITRNFSGTDISHLDALSSHKSPLITEDGRDVASAAVMLAAMTHCATKGIIVSCHCEDTTLSSEARPYRTPPASNIERANALLATAEDIATERNITLAEAASRDAKKPCRVHICHVSTARSMQAIRRAKADAACCISCEITPHHLALTDNPRHLVNPPLRSEADRRALLESLADGTADVIATDHAPHTEQDKASGAPGFPGLETAFAVCNTELVVSGIIGAQRLSALMSGNPAHLLGFDSGECPKGRLAAGFAADIVLVNPDEKWTIDEANFYTKGKRSPFAGKTVYGKVKSVFRRGKQVFPF